MGHLPSEAGMRRGKEYLTHLGAHMRVDRDSAPIEVLGTIDELNCWIGVIVALTSSRTVRETLIFIQHDLRYLSDQISIPESSLLSLDHVSRLEAAVDQLQAESGGSDEGLGLPGGKPCSAFSHLARAVCHRAERRLCSFDQLEDAVGAALGRRDRHDFGLPYLNALSDLLLVVSRIENRGTRDLKA